MTPYDTATRPRPAERPTAKPRGMIAPKPGLSPGPGAEETRAAGSVVVSIHDVMPETMVPVARTLAVLEAAGWERVTLLVVPGRSWSRRDLACLRDWDRAGHILAGHGWSHDITGYGGLWHRLHGLLISRRVAEHLALERDGILDLMRRCHGWFADQGLTPPRLYVPPAWALGAVPRAALADLPFDRVEVFAGEIACRSGRLTRQALVGFEADTAVRAPLIRAFNAANRLAAAALGLPLRVGIHPRDLDFRLGEELRALIAALAPRGEPVGWTGAGA